jgi:vacuolar-type H+-ATPase subunit H
VFKAEEHARGLLLDAETRARSITEDAEHQLREEVMRLESQRTQLADDAVTIAQHIEGERSRLRSALVEMLAWVDEQIQPAASVLAQHEEGSGGEAEQSEASSSDDEHASEARMPDMQRAPATQPAGGGR